jgi:hypothetical protein
VKKARELQRLDVWISGDGGPALAEEECALLGLPPAVPGALAASDACSRYRDVGGHYSYTLNVGPRAGRLLYQTAVRDGTTTPPPRMDVTTNPAAGTVTVSFDLPHTPVPQKFGLTVEAGWSKAPKAVHHTVTLNELDIHATLDGDTEPNLDPVTGVIGQQPPPAREQTPDPGEWIMFAAVNGMWKQLAPDALDHVQVDGDTPYSIALNETFDFWLPEGVPVTLYVSGRECDIPLMDCTKDVFGAPPTDRSDPFAELGYNDKPGRIKDPLQNTPFLMAMGRAKYEPARNPDFNTTFEDLSDASCGGPCYTLWATAT